MRGKNQPLQECLSLFYLFIFFAAFQSLIIEAELTNVSVHTMTHGKLRLDVTCCLLVTFISLTITHLESPLQSFVYLYRLKYKKL